MKNKLLKAIFSISGFSPIAFAMSCGPASYVYIRGAGNDISYIKKGFANNLSEHKNVMSSYFNATDMLAALGYFPDLASASGDGTIYSDYLKTLLGNNNLANKNKPVKTGKVTIIPGPKIMDGKAVDREAIINHDISTLLLNEWERVDESKFLGITPCIIYTSMADGHARFNDEDYYDKQWNTPWGLNTYEAFEMFAKGLDRAYPGNNFLDSSKQINRQVKENVKKLNISLIEKNKNQKNKTILVLEVAKKENEVYISSIRSGGVYSILYSKKQDRGLGYNFPRALNPKNIKSNGFSLRAIDSASLAEEFKGKADQIIILNNPQSPDKKFIQDNAKNAAKIMLKNSTILKNIHILDRDEFYDSVWGIYGMNRFLSNFNREFGVNAVLNNIQEFNTNKKLKRLR